MSAATSLPVQIPHQETTSETGIRVQNSSAHGGYATIPHFTLKRAIKELRGASLSVFLYVWERTVSFRKFEREIPFPQFVENTSYEARSIGDAINFLDQNGFLSVRKNGSRSNIYGIAMQLLQDAGCLEDLPTDGGKSLSAKIADQNSPPLGSPLKDLRSLNKHTHSTPVVTTTGNRPEPEPDGGYEGYDVPQPEIPEQESEDRYRTRFDPHAEIREPEAEREYEGYDVPLPEIEIGNHPVAHKLKGCRLHPRNIVKFMRQYDPEHIMVIVRNFEEDMAKRHNVKREDFPKVLYWRLREDVTSWDVDSWVSDVQREFDNSVKSDKGRLLGVVEYAAKEQNLEVQEVLGRLDVQAITYQDMEKWAAVELRIEL